MAPDESYELLRTENAYLITHLERNQNTINTYNSASFGGKKGNKWLTETWKTTEALLIKRSAANVHILRLRI